MFCRGPTIERGIKESDGGGVGGRGRQAIDAVEWHLFFPRPRAAILQHALMSLPQQVADFFLRRHNLRNRTSHVCENGKIVLLQKG